MTRQKQRKTTRLLLSVALAVALVTSSFAAPAVASSDGIQIFADGEDGEDSWVDTAKAYVSGVVNRAKYGVSSIGDDEPDPKPTIDSAAGFVNNHSSEITSWYNTHYAAPSDDLTYEVELSNADGDTEVRYLEVDSNGTDLTGVRVVNSTNRATDVALSLEGQWVDSLDDETETWYDTYVAADRPVKRNDTFTRRIFAQYASDTDGVDQL